MNRFLSHARQLDPWIVAPAVALTLVGLANLHALALAGATVSSRLVASQLASAFVGLAACAGTFSLARSDRHRALAWVFPVALFAVLLTLAGFAAPLRAVRRWIALGPWLVQPSEFLKLAVVLAVARWFGDAPLLARSLWHTLTGLVGLVLVPVALVLAQPDLGTSLLFVVIAASTLTVTPFARRSLVALVGLMVVPAIVFARLLVKPYQLARLEAFLHPEAYPGASWQASQALHALSAGRWFGSEPSWLARGHLPDAHTDFALVAWASARGLAGVFVVLALFAVLVHRLFAVARETTDRYDLAVTTGVGALVFWQVALNAAMELGLTPVVGVPLPLVSYGGSNLVTTLAALGLALGIHARVRANAAPEASAAQPAYRGAIA